jgi:hypothetical protein
MPFLAQRFFRRPSIRETTPDRSRWNSSLFSPGRKVLRLLKSCNPARVSTISRLHLARRPNAVLDRVRSVVVFPLKREGWTRTWPHVVVEDHEVLPARVVRDPAASVLGVVSGLGVSAALPHIPPNTPFRYLRVPVLPSSASHWAVQPCFLDVLPGALATLASTALSRTRAEGALEDCDGLPTGTNTRPARGVVRWWRSRSRGNCQPPENLVDEIHLSKHCTGNFAKRQG